MNLKSNVLLFLVVFLPLYGYSQEVVNKIRLTPSPDTKIWEEGKIIQFQVTLETEAPKPLSYAIVQGKQEGMNLDSAGLFTWTPAFELVDRIEKIRIIQIVLEIRDANSNAVQNRSVDIRVAHQNRPPVVGELNPFYIRYNTTNTYQINSSAVFDSDNDPIVVIPAVEQLPEGLTISSQGEIKWSPSFTQFRKLKEEPIFIQFYVEDQPGKLQTKGRLKLVATQMDLPPTITVVPKTTYYKIRENETVNLRFYLGDPNGDDDIDTFGFITSLGSLPDSLLRKNTPTQYEFIWRPGYQFVTDPKDSLQFHINFFAIDKSKLREVKRIDFTVINTINEAETDKKLYGLYRGSLQRAWELVEQLREKERELKTAYNRAKRGKKHRSVINASLGATTGLSSIFTKERPDTQRLISTIGGTTVLTIGTLEATEVIGKSVKDIIDRLNYIIEKKNEIQTKGDIFARDFSLRSARRGTDFTRRMDDFMQTLNLKGLVALELDASWEPKIKSTDTAIKKIFKDFTVEEFSEK